MIKGSKELIAYGERSRYVTSVRIAHPVGGRPSPDAFGKVFHVAAPLQDSVGVITPSSLHYVATTRGSFMPDIDPKQHTLMIHGLVDRPLTFTMEDLKRLPSVTRLHFIECAGNRHNARQTNVQETHGMVSCAEWTGVLLSTLLKECGVKGSATWFVAEGAEEVKGASSMPVAKAMDDVLVAYGMNGEAVRPQNGFPLRLVIPGFEGIFSTKYVRRIKLVDRYYLNYNDFGHLDENPKVAALDYQIGPKSVITYPSGGQQLPGRGFYEISGLAWSGGGAIRTVEVSTDGGKKWNRAEFKGTPQRMAFARFGYGWNWDGNETEILSRCTDEIGQVQPTREQVAKYWNVPFERNYRVPGLDNSVMPWRIGRDGSVKNGLA
jgi:sulfane dehydrogenase subunit SoxC